MIYILTEDSKDGFDLCSMIARIYHGDSGIKTESYKGIINLKAFLAEFCNTIQDNDTVLLTYDNIIENPLVVRCYSEAYEIWKARESWDSSLFSLCFPLSLRYL